MMDTLMLTWRRIWTVARRELKSMFDHPTGYVLLIVFVAINQQGDAVPVPDAWREWLPAWPESE